MTYPSGPFSYPADHAFFSGVGFGASPNHVHPFDAYPPDHFGFGFYPGHPMNTYPVSMGCGFGEDASAPPEQVSATPPPSAAAASAVQSPDGLAPGTPGVPAGTRPAIPGIHHGMHHGMHHCHCRHHHHHHPEEHHDAAAEGPPAAGFGYNVGFGWNFFHAISHAFHDMSNAVAAAGEMMAPMFGVPPGVSAALAKLLMHAHAGDAHAKAELHKAAQNPKTAALIAKMNATMKGHPHFEAFKQHAAHGVLPPGHH